MEFSCFMCLSETAPPVLGLIDGTLLRPHCPEIPALPPLFQYVAVVRIVRASLNLQPPMPVLVNTSMNTI